MALTGKTIVFSGTLKVKRAESKQLAEDAGARVTKSVSSKTTTLVTGDGSGSATVHRAKNLGVEMWTEKMFFDALKPKKKKAGRRKKKKTMCKQKKKRIFKDTEVEDEELPTKKLKAATSKRGKPKGMASEKKVVGNEEVKSEVEQKELVKKIEKVLTGPRLDLVIPTLLKDIEVKDQERPKKKLKAATPKRGKAKRKLSKVVGDEEVKSDVEQKEIVKKIKVSAGAIPGPLIPNDSKGLEVEEEESTKNKLKAATPKRGRAKRKASKKKVVGGEVARSEVEQKEKVKKVNKVLAGTIPGLLISNDSKDIEVENEEPPRKRFKAATPKRRKVKRMASKKKVIGDEEVKSEVELKEIVKKSKVSAGTISGPSIPNDPKGVEFEDEVPPTKKMKAATPKKRKAKRKATKKKVIGDVEVESEVEQKETVKIIKVLAGMIPGPLIPNDSKNIEVEDEEPLKKKLKAASSKRGKAKRASKEKVIGDEEVKSDVEQKDIVKKIKELSCTIPGPLIPNDSKDMEVEDEEPPKKKFKAATFMRGKADRKAAKKKVIGDEEMKSEIDQKEIVKKIKVVTGHRPDPVIPNDSKDIEVKDEEPPKKLKTATAKRGKAKRKASKKKVVGDKKVKREVEQKETVKKTKVLAGPKPDRVIPNDVNDIQVENEEAPKKISKAGIPKRGKPRRKASKQKVVSEEDVKSEVELKETVKKTKLLAGPTPDCAFPTADNWTVDPEYNIELNAGPKNDKFYIIQLVQDDAGWALWTLGGCIGGRGESSLKRLKNYENGIKAFERKFRDKTKNQWHQRDNFVKGRGKYDIVETVEGDGDEDSPIGKLNEEQIGKGQDVLSQIEGVLKRGEGIEALTDLSNKFYKMIPTGTKTRPAPITTMDMLRENQERLKFYLRMGFENMEEEAHLEPISGILALPLPDTLEDAAAKICGSGEIKAAVKNGRELAKTQAGNPKKEMVEDLYASIMLYTSNAIFRSLNKALRDEDRIEVKNYFKYLRLFLEAMNLLPAQQTSLFRGISGDLHDQYEVGSTVTWWGVSSCTSDEKVAWNFVNGCGGKCTFFSLDVKSAWDIGSISFYSNEKESLLAPGTQLKVKAKKRKGRITGIHLEEVGRVVC